MFAAEFENALPAAQRAHELGRRHRDPDLEFLGLLFAGEIQLALGHVEPGLAMLDEAGVAVRASGVSPLAGSVIYCGVIFGCLTRADWERASHWTEQFHEWCGRHGAHTFPGLCRLHRAEVLGVRGELAEAHCEVEQARQALAKHTPWAVGDACRVLGEIQLARGSLDEATASFREAHTCGWDPQPGLALVALSQGQPDVALKSILRSLEDPGWVNRQRRGLLLGYATIIAAQGGAPGKARDLLSELEAQPALWSTSALTALVTRARGELAAAEGRPGDAIAGLRSAVAQWQAIDSPLAAAQARCRLAELLAAEGDGRAAEMELSAAAAAFERAGATALLERCRKPHRTPPEGRRR
jgi:tetratricopeptide (TPR) repeat protein